MLRDIGSSTPVADMAMRQPVCVPRDTTILCASRIMRSFHVAELVVTEEPHGLPIPMGIVSACDIVTRIIAPGLDPGVFTAGDIAWASAVHTKVSDSLSHTLQLLPYLFERQRSTFRYRSKRCLSFFSSPPARHGCSRHR